ncbi:ExeM/NucH family extracellular endonuclease [Pseudooceanicola onchidii]|uniref:ExeM/NucH family extracellular endonuclease n=1 Tax=Pseudooceanicola onchidii TaxID=2562279 RepID=UPI0010AB2675|nr:ExeM/NucH family extracellular endonuclease [Pseudooceanicola onchidii]
MTSAAISKSDLVITGVIDGPLSGGVPKAIEIYVAADVADLSIYGLGSANNGQGTDGEEFTFPAVAAAAGTYIYVASETDGFTAYFGFAPTYVSGMASINGDDAIELFMNDVVVDLFGQIDVDGTGQAWDHVDGWAARKPGTGPSALFDAADWVFSGPDALDGETTNATAATAFPTAQYGVEQPILINEVVGSTTSTDVEFIELRGAPSASLDGLSLIVVESDAGAANGTIDFQYDFGAGDVLGENGFLLLGNASVATTYGVTPNIVIPENSIENSSYTLLLVETASIIGGSIAGTEVVIDSVGVSDGGEGDSFALDAPVVGPDGSYLPAGVYRVSTGPDTDTPEDWGISDYNNDPAVNTPTAGTFTSGTTYADHFIHDVQGSTNLADGTLVGTSGAADESPLLGAAVRVQAVVTQVMPGLGGFYIQEEDADADDDAFSSEGVFVASNASVSVGDVVTVEGIVGEIEGETRITADAVSVDGTGSLPTATAIEFPTATVLVDTDGDYVANLEAYEGMLVNVPEDMSITEMFQLDRFGTLRLSSEGQLEQFTQSNLPSVEGYQQHLKDVAARSLVLDDGSNVQNPDPITVPRLGTDETLDQGDVVRMGDVYSGLTGVLSYSKDEQSSSEESEYRIHQPTGGTLSQVNTRDAAPADVGGTLKVTAFNVLNYFTSIDGLDGNTGPAQNQDPRGADNLSYAGMTEFERQEAKIVAAINAVAADVVGLIEIENDPLGSVSLMALTNALNAAGGTYAYVDAGPIEGAMGGALEGDAIKVGFLYDYTTVTLNGDFAILDETVDARFQTEGVQRPALAQSFTEIASGESFTAVVNHLKSKGSVLPGEDAIGDGQGNNNQTRTDAAEALVDWLETDPTGAGDDGYIILGDLNAYAKEDPIRAIEAGADGIAGTADDYTNLVGKYAPGAYSYVFDGQTGSLDHALASSGLAGKVTGATVWNINADEPDAIDYNLDFGRPGDIYSDDAYRSSDHDPIVVGLDLAGLNVTQLAQFDSLVGSAGSEVVAFEDGRFYVTNGEANRIDVFTLAEGKVDEIDLAGLGGITSVAVKNGLVAVVLGNGEGAGKLALIPADDLTNMTALDIGIGPDMVTFSGDGAQVYVAIEGEPGEVIDPKGGVAIVTLADVLANSTVSMVGFDAFDAQVDALREAGVRIFPGKLPSTDFEAEYIAIDPQTGELIVTLQEANAVAIIDPVTETVTEIRPLGTVDHSIEGNGLDASDKDGGINIQTWNVQGLRMPDAIATFVVDGKTYYATANEGDARDADARVEDLTLDPTAFPDAAELQQEQNLGRLEVSSIDGDIDGDGDYDELYSYGTRSFTIFDDAGNVVFDSGDFFEQYIAANFPERFNSHDATQDNPVGDDGRSDAKGPEPEAIAIAEVEGRMVAIVGMERDSGLFLFEVSNPAHPRFLSYVNGVANADYRPEVITVIPPEQSATGRTEIAVSYEESGTTSVFELTFEEPSDPGDFGEGGTNPDPLDPADYGFDLQITEIWPGNEPGGNLTSDWIEITNFGDVAWVAGIDPDLYYDDESASAVDADMIFGITSIAPGESVVVVIDDEGGIAGFEAVWGNHIGDDVQIGWSDGAGLGQGGDAATILFGDAEVRAVLDFEAYPDAELTGGQSYDPVLGMFSYAGVFGAYATDTLNDEGQAAVGTPGALPVDEPVVYTLEILHVTDQEPLNLLGTFTDIINTSAVLNALEAQDIGNDGVADNTLRLSSGDAVIPGLFYDASAAVFGSAGIADIQLQNEMGFEAIALGNHEFDKGTADLAALIDGSAPGDFSALSGTALDGQDFTGTNMPYLSSNLDFSTDANMAPLEVAGGQAPQGNVVTSSTVIEKGGELLGIVGATTPTLGSISSPGGIGISPAPFDTDPTPEQLDALAAQIQAEVDALLAANPSMNKVILLAHMQQISIEQELAARLVDVDVIVAGGSNTRLFDEDDRVRDGDTDQGTYPIIVDNAGGTHTAIVNTDGSYKYVGRLVIDFDSDGNIIPDSYDAAVSGAYATDAQGVADLGAEGLVDTEVKAIVDAIENQIVATEGNVFGYSDVFLNGNRAGDFSDGDPDGVRTQETNLGNLTADANLAAAQIIDNTVVVSIKNGGGIRASIGETVVPPGGTGFERVANQEVRDSDGNVVKAEGGISQNDIATALAFNNGLAILTLTKQELVDILEHGVSALPGVSGRFPQISGLQFSFDPDLPSGARVVNAAITDADGNDIAVLVRDGEVFGDALQEFRVVTLDFLSQPRFDDAGNFIGAGDGYPFPNTNTDPTVGEVADQATLDRINKVVLTEDGVRTGDATFADNGTEQDALAEYLDDFFGQDTMAFNQEDTGPEGDERIQNLNYREDTVIDTPEATIIVGEGDRDRLVGTEGADIIVSGEGRYETMTGLGGADVFVFGAEALNGMRERDTITDFEVGVDAIGLMSGVTVAEIREAGPNVIIYLEDPSGFDDAIHIRGEGLTASNITIIEDYWMAGA